jgi:hypothetical protein
MNVKTADSYATFSMVLGILSFVGWIPFGIFSLIFSSIAKKNGTTKTNSAMAGTILSIISGIINVMMIVCFFIFFALIFMGFNWV